MKMRGQNFYASLLRLAPKTERKINDRKVWRGKWFSMSQKTAGPGCFWDNFIPISKSTCPGYPQVVHSPVTFTRFVVISFHPLGEPVEQSNNQPALLIRARCELYHSPSQFGVWYLTGVTARVDGRRCDCDSTSRWVSSLAYGAFINSTLCGYLQLSLFLCFNTGKGGSVWEFFYLSVHLSTFGFTFWIYIHFGAFL